MLSTQGLALLDMLASLLAEYPHGILGVTDLATGLVGTIETLTTK